MAVRLELLISEGPERGRVVPLPVGRVVIGSAPDCELQLPDASVAPRHVELTVDDSGAATVRNLTGQRTVRINGLPGEGSVGVGSFLSVGTVELVLRQHGESGPHGTLARTSPVTDGLEPTLRQATPQGTDAASGHPLESVRTSNVDLDAALAATSQSKAGAPLQPGEVISQRYRIIEPIAAGGMGEVYRAEHVELGRPFAVKVMRPHLSQDKDFVARFKREAIAASAIGNINIIDVSDFGQTDDGRFYFAMEHLAGETLAQVVEAHGAQSVERTIRLGLQVARALAAAHAKGIIHRDLKPENVMVLQDRGHPDLVKVLDFGVAKVTRALEPAGQTTLGVVVGTPQYMSPEQASGLNVDARSDIYALGLMLYELLTGRQPFSAPTAQLVMSKQIHEAPPPLTAMKPDLVVPRGLEGLVMDMLAKAPAARPQSMSEVVKRLEALEKAGSTDRSRPSAPRPAPKEVAAPPPPRPSRSLLWAGLGLVVGSILVGLLAVLAFRKEPAPPDAPPATTPTPVPAATPALETPAVPPVAPPPEPRPVVPVTVVRMLVSTPPGATVREGSAILGTTPLSISSEPNAVRSLVVSLKGHEDETIRLDFTSEQPLVVSLKPLRKATPAPPGKTTPNKKLMPWE